MRYFRILLFLVITSSFLFPHNGRHKGWKHKKKHKIRKIHKKPRVNIRLGYNYYWPSWGWNHRWCYRHNSRDIVVVQNYKTANDLVVQLATQAKELGMDVRPGAVFSYYKTNSGYKLEQNVENKTLKMIGALHMHLI